MRVIHALRPNHIPQLHALYQTVWWADTRTLEETHRVLEGSSLHIGLVDEEDNLIGFTRVLTDGVFKALMFDVIVHDDWRGRGLGNRLMAEVKAHPWLAGVRHLELYCREDMKAFYEQHGFRADLGDIHLMRHTV